LPSVIEGFQLPEGAMTLSDPAAAPPTVVLVDDDLLGLDLLDHLISGLIGAVKQHTVIGGQIFGESRSSLLQLAARWP
jgi:hypothetical protein